jgi:hypothetical protein
MASPVPVPVPDYTALLASFLLTDYLAQLDDRRFTAEERFERRMRLEYRLWELEDLQPTSAHLIIPEIDKVFAGDLDTRLFPAIEWYLDFLSGKNEQWLRLATPARLVRFWRALPARQLRDRALQTLLLVEASTNPDHPDRSQIPPLFNQDIGIDPAGDFTAKGREIADVLLREALAAPPFRAGSVNLRVFSMRVLRFCLNPSAVPDPQVVDRALALAGDIDDATREELRNQLAS